MKLPAVLTLLFSFLFVSCTDYKKNASHQQVSNASIKAGEKLAIRYCGSCHLLPDPSLLDTKSWETGVLPEMGPRLGIFAYDGSIYPSFKKDMFVDKNYYPSKPVLSFDDWQHILDYFTATSPDSLLPANKPVPLTLTEKLFEPAKPSFQYYMPSASYIKIDPSHQLMMGDAFMNKLFFFDKDLRLTDSMETRGAITDVIEDPTQLIFCITGLLHPNNRKFGSIESFARDKLERHILSKDLMRPVQFSRADLNKDGQDDYLICEFGNLDGALSWIEKKDTNYIRHVIRGAPGALRAYIDDYNHDGLPDIWSLFAQGDESVFLFTNKGNGVFDANQVLRFMPSYGSSYFELNDFNKDGYPDIIYTCGDNADFSPVFKPYHGVYIFINDGMNNFTKQYFYPLNGCYKAIAKDFDNDNDLDIAAIAFFADFKDHPEEAFVYLKNNGDFNFTPYSMESTKYGRWLTMDAEDFDGDGRIDIALGNFSLTDPVFEASIDWKQQPPFLLLKNIQ